MAPVVWHRSAPLLSFGAVVIGGLIAWTLAYSGVDAWGLVVGVLVSVILSVVGARRAASPRSMSVMAGFGFAFILLTWPILWLVVGYLRYVITGQAIGD